VSANYLLRRIAALFNEKDGTDDGKRMASNWEVILTPFLKATLKKNIMKARLINVSAVFMIIFFAGQAQNVEVETFETLAKKSGCIECHNDVKNAIGPLFSDISLRYKDDPGAGETLIERVKHGGKGNWTKVSRGAPMPPYEGLLSDAEIKNLVDWMLGL